MDATQNVSFLDFFNKILSSRFIVRVYINNFEDIVLETSNLSSIRNLVSMILKGKMPKIVNKRDLLEIKADNIRIEISHKAY
ncbi:MAG TPA: hypothetical protein ENK81_01690 [Euryarchaeota archaeon]|nr:MAG: hypothetical protein DRN26_05610 [Thermoplasmata archaeon]HHC19103.1 hypothetical protein [Euryarchaeota archaeon]